MRIRTRLERLEGRHVRRRRWWMPRIVELRASERPAFTAAHPADDDHRAGDPPRVVLIIRPDEEGHAEEHHASSR